MTKRSVRERFTLLSGIDTDLGDVEKALEEIAEKEAVVEETAKNDKKKLDSAKAAEMSNRALKNLGGTIYKKIRKYKGKMR